VGRVTLDTDTIVGHTYRHTLSARLQLDTKPKMSMQIAAASMAAGVSYRLQSSAEKQVGHNGR